MLLVIISIWLLVDYIIAWPLSTEFFEPVLSADFALYVAAGFVAQVIDGALGMAYGASASTFLLSIGVSPAAASASIHASEIFTSGVSGWMHFRFQNVNKKLFQTLLLPGMLGAAGGALVLSSLGEYQHWLKPIVAAYTFILGFLIVLKALRRRSSRLKTDRIPVLASFGGFMDSVGGGGWGPIVSSTLIAGGRHPRYTVGSVNAAEFFVAVVSSLTFFVMIGLTHLHVILGLIIGGVAAAPLGALIARRLPAKRFMLWVGVAVMAISLRLVVLAFVQFIPS